MYKEVYTLYVYASFSIGKGDGYMYYNIYGKEIQLDDRLVEIYELIEGTLNDRSLELLLLLDEIDGKSLSARNLKLQVEKSMKQEIEIMIELTNPETINKALELAKKMEGDFE